MLGSGNTALMGLVMQLHVGGVNEYVPSYYGLLFLLVYMYLNNNG